MCLAGHGFTSSPVPLAIGRIVDATFLRAGFVDSAEIVFGEIHTPSLHEYIPSSVADIYSHSVISQLPVKVLEIGLCGRRSNQHREIMTAFRWAASAAGDGKDGNFFLHG